MTSTLGALLKKATAPSGANSTLTQYGMLRNPFPPARTIYPEVIYNQQQALTKFANSVEAVIGPDLTRRTLAVIGGTGQGKSHFLRHCQYEVRQADLPLVCVEFLAGTSSAVTLVREVFRAADDHAKESGEHDLLSAIVNRLEPGEVSPVRQTDLKNALDTLVQSRQPKFQAPDSYGRFNSEVLQDVCRRWISGESLTQAERRYLRVSGRLATASLMIRVMTELFALARKKGLFRGLMICLDEVEAIFFSGISTSKVQAFLQDLRYLVDEAVGQSSGYSLFIVAGSTSRGAQVLRDYNYPLFERLGFDTDARLLLHEVETFDEARKFADVYLQFELERFNETRRTKVSLKKAKSLISDDDLESVFVGGRTKGEIRNQALLLAGLHRIVESKRA